MRANIMKRTKKIQLIIIALLLTSQSILPINSFAYSAQFAQTIESDLEFNPINSYAALAFNVKTNEVVFRKNTTEKLYMASITKLMTALIITEKYNLNQNIVSKKNYKSDLTKYNAPQVLSGGAIRKGEIFSAKDLFKVMLVYSANDTTLLFADRIAGSQKAFVRLMNKKAQKLGMKNTLFKNPNGLSNGGDEVGQCTTLEDMALLLKVVINNPQIMDAVKLRLVVLKSNYRIGTYKSTNLLFTQYSGVYGLKTGMTSKAGNCLSSIANIGDDDYVIITLKANKRSAAAKDHMTLYDALKKAHIVEKNLETEFVEAPLIDLEQTVEPILADNSNIVESNVVNQVVPVVK